MLDGVALVVIELEPELVVLADPEVTGSDAWVPDVWLPDASGSDACGSDA